MRGICHVLTLVVVGLLIPATLPAQTADVFPPSAGVGPAGARTANTLIPQVLQNMELPTWDALGLGSIQMTPRVRVGYQEFAMNVSLPSSIFIFVPIPQALDLKLDDANAWVGSARVDVHTSQGVSFFLQGEGSASRSVLVRTGEDPLLGTLGMIAGVSIPLVWKGSQFEWWALEGGAAYAVVPGVSILAGVRRDHFTLGMSDPTDPYGIAAFARSLPLSTLNYDGDIQTKLWIPYAGVQMEGSNYRASLIWSPFVDARIQIPLSFILAVTGDDFGFPNLFDFDLGVSWRYSVFRPGAFLEGRFEYDLNVVSWAQMALWAKGSWLNVRGQGNLDFGAAVNLEVPSGTPLFAGSAFASGSAEASSSRYSGALGLSTVIPF